MMAFASSPLYSTFRTNCKSEAVSSDQPRAVLASCLCPRAPATLQVSGGRGGSVALALAALTFDITCPVAVVAGFAIAAWPFTVRAPSETYRRF